MTLLFETANPSARVDREDLALLRQMLQEAGDDDEEILLRLSPDQLVRLDVNQDGRLDYDDLEAMSSIIDTTLLAKPYQPLLHQEKAS